MLFALFNLTAMLYAALDTEEGRRLDLKIRELMNDS